MISIIIPTYQHAEALLLCLASIAHQTFSDYEVIVVDDGSTDSTKEVVRASSVKVKYIKQENGGAPQARNRGFAESSGEYVIFCDADVVMVEDCLAKMLQTLRMHSDCQFVYSSFRFGPKRFRSFPFDPARLRRENYIHSTSLVRREAVVSWDELLKKLQDWDFFLTIVERGGKGVWIPKELFTVQVTRPGMSSWVPRIAYTKLGRSLGLWKTAVSRYDEACDIVKDKHDI